ncbi:MAG: glutamine-hydrolyzing GMP synthase [Armatimonadota bacterium]
MVVVIDFGAQYSQLITRRIRECRVYSEMVSFETPLEEILAKNPMGIILSGGPNSVYDPGAPRIDPRIFDQNIPILGICYGMQLMSFQLNGRVVAGQSNEYGKTELRVLDESNIFAGLNPELICWMSHGDLVQEPPPGFDVIARTLNTPVAAIANESKRQFGVQFHPEVAHTPWGVDVLRNFLYKQCGCEGTWTMGSFVAQSKDWIRQKVGSGRVLCALSGGVDSSTTAALVHEAIADQITCVCVNHGLLRAEEPERVRATFEQNFKINLVYVDAEDRFLARLDGITDPEQKRKIIGEEFVRVFEEEAKKMGQFDFLAQGTLYPDVIESGTKSAALIKTHHNVGGLPENMKFELLEPMRDLFKDEVRGVATELGMPSELVWRQPFPGPGLAIRIIGEVTRDRLEMLRRADWVVIDEIKRAGLYRQLFHAFAVLLPIRSTGVMGDHRTYAYPICIRAVTSDDVMTADWARLPYEVLERISSRITNEVPGVNRVVYDISSKPPATIEWE